MMKKIFVIVLFISAFFVRPLHSQEYFNAIGLRVGLSQGISYKRFLSRTNAFEGLMTLRWGGVNLTGLYEWYMPALNVKQLYFYYGAGAHVGFWESGSANPWFSGSTSYTVIGIDAIAGLEYVLKEMPFNVSLDWKPAFNLVGHTGFWGDELGLSFRYIF